MDHRAGLPTGLAGPRPGSTVSVLPSRSDGGTAPTLSRLPRDRDSRLSSIPDAVEAIRRGGMVLVVDDEDRENEGDLVMAASHATTEAINVMVTHGRGLVCLPLTPDRCDQLQLGPMVPERAGREETAFTVSIDLEVPGSTGISAADRARTIRHAVSQDARPGDFRRPGHVFPLRARPGGVLERPGHTEAAVDLARLAGLPPAGVICEVMNPDGTMARLPELRRMAAEQDMPLVSIADLVAHRRRNDQLIRRLADRSVDTAWGPAREVHYLDHHGTQHVALVVGEVTQGSDVLVRVHSECLTGDVFGSLRCDCGEQLDAAMRVIQRVGRGVVVYVRGHEGRGIGIVEKLRAYALQDTGHDTVDANVALGHPVDGRDFLPAGQILRDLGVARVRLLTNNPTKRTALSDLGVRVTERVPLRVDARPENTHYLATKHRRLGHLLEDADRLVPAPVITEIA